LHDSPNWDLWMAKSDGTIERAIFRNRPLLSDSYIPAWSPDGKIIIIPIVQPNKDSLGGFIAVDPATGQEHVVAVSSEHIYHGPAWMPDGSALVAPSVQIDAEHLQSQIGFVNYPGGEYRPLTADTNDYSNLGISKDGKTLAALQSRLRFQVALAPGNDPDKLQPIPLQSQLPIWGWTWLSNDRLLIPQGADLKTVTPKDEETVLHRDPKHLSDQVTVCGDGRYIVYRVIGTTSMASANLARMDLDGSNVKQLTHGLNEREPTCPKTGAWVYFVDSDDNGYVKRVPVEGGTPETVVKYSVGAYALSPGGTEIASLELRELDHKLILRLDNVNTHQMKYADMDQHALPNALAYTPDGQGIVYMVREKGVDNLWLQPLDGKPHRQLTHFTKDKIFRFAFSSDGSQIAIETGETESDAILLHDVSK
jgi:Tol biopolymer transport system component